MSKLAIIFKRLRSNSASNEHPLDNAGAEDCRNAHSRGCYCQDAGITTPIEKPSLVSRRRSADSRVDSHFVTPDKHGSVETRRRSRSASKERRQKSGTRSISDPKLRYDSSIRSDGTGAFSDHIEYSVADLSAATSATDDISAVEVDLLEAHVSAAAPIKPPSLPPALWSVADFIRLKPKAMRNDARSVEARRPVRVAVVCPKDTCGHSGATEVKHTVPVACDECHCGGGSICKSNCSTADSFPPRDSLWALSTAVRSARSYISTDSCRRSGFTTCLPSSERFIALLSDALQCETDAVRASSDDSVASSGEYVTEQTLTELKELARDARTAVGAAEAAAALNRDARAAEGCRKMRLVLRIAQPYIDSLLDEKRSLADWLDKRNVETDGFHDYLHDRCPGNGATLANESRDDWSVELPKTQPTRLNATLFESFSKVTVGAEDMASELAQIKSMISGGYAMSCLTNAKKAH